MPSLSMNTQHPPPPPCFHAVLSHRMSPYDATRVSGVQGWKATEGSHERVEYDGGGWDPAERPQSQLRPAGNLT